MSAHETSIRTEWEHAFVAVHASMIGRTRVSRTSGVNRRLLPVLRTRSHEWFLRAARVGYAMMMLLAATCTAVLAAKSPLTTVLGLVIVLGALGAVAGVIGSAMAFLTRPVRESHAAALNETAATVARRVESGMFTDYGDEHRDRPMQAFRAHYKKLTARLDVWDDMRDGAAEAQRVLGEHIEAAMVEHEIAAGTYYLPRLLPFMRELAMDHARGQAPKPPRLEWHGFSSAETPGSPAVPGPPYGRLGPVGDREWINLPPREHETTDQWGERARTCIERLERFIAATHASALPYGRAAVDAQEKVMAFKREQLSTILNALQLVQESEAPRVRRRCESC